MSLYSNESEPQALSFDQPTGAAFLALISDQVTRLGTVTVLTLPVIFFLLAITNCFSLKDKDGNKIPSGPLGLGKCDRNCTGPMSNLVDFVPLLQKFDTPLHARGKKLHNDLVSTYGGLIKDVEKKMAWGVTVPDCLAKSMLGVREAEQLDNLDMAILASAFMIGGVETTAAVMQWFSALIPAYQHIQKKEHDELDRVVGRERLPTVKDEGKLPYCHAIIKEVERCYNPFWLGTPHVSVKDFTYKGKFIPKDSVVVLNTWTMHYDEKRFENPDVFDVSFLPRLISCELSIPILFDGKYSLRSSEGHRRGREVGVFWVFLLPSGNS